MISFTAVLTAAVLPSPILANRLSSTLYLSEVPDRLSEPERVIYDSLQVETLAYCEGRRDCLDQRPYQILDLLNARRQLLLFYGDQGIQERLAARCEGRQGTVRTVGTGPWTQCLREIGRLSSREGMALIGEHRLGVTRAGFNRLKYGMPIGVVTFILGDRYDTMAAAAGPGITGASYRWRGRGGATIIVTFRNLEAVSMGQLNLR